MKLDSYWEAEETPRWIKLSDKYDGWGACARRALFVVLSASHWNCGMGPNGACPTFGSPPLAPLRSLYWLKAATGCHRCGLTPRLSRRWRMAEQSFKVRWHSRGFHYPLPVRITLTF